MFAPREIGFVRSRYKETKQIPKGLGTTHEMDGVLDILAEFEIGLTDIDGFSHLVVLWVFDRAQGFDLLGTPFRRVGLTRPAIAYRLTVSSANSRRHYPPPTPRTPTPRASGR